MGFQYTAYLVLGVELEKRTVKAGTETRYNEKTGEPIVRELTDTELVTPLGTVFENPVVGMSDEEADEWYNGDFRLIGGECEKLYLGMILGGINPRYEETENIDLIQMESKVNECRKRLLEFKIVDSISTMLVSEAS